MDIHLSAVACPSGIAFKANIKDFTTNVYIVSEWNRMEAAGAIFLPCAGYRTGTTVTNVGSIGEYWKLTYSDGDQKAYCTLFDDYFITGGMCNIHTGNSVRLVTE